MNKSKALALVLSGGRETAKHQRLASRILVEFGDELEKALFASFLPEKEKRRLAAALSLAQNLAEASAKEPLPESYNNAEYVFARYSYLASEKQEKFLVIGLNTKLHKVYESVVSVGTLDSAIVHPRDVFREAISNNVHSLLLLHNHPSGDPTPSKEDDALTKQLVEAGKTLGIKVVDHIVIGKGCWYSYSDMKKLDNSFESKLKGILSFG